MYRVTEPDTQTWTLRAAAPSDLPALVRLIRAFYDEDGFTTPDDEIEDNLLLLLPSPAADLTLADADGAVRGFALTTDRVVLESGVVAELQDLYVQPAYRGKGIGSALIASALRWAQSRSAAMLEIVVAANGRDVGDLQAFYARRGFSDERRRILSVRV